MPWNGRKINCYCEGRRCGGKPLDWRTHRDHANDDAANRPLYPVNALDENNHFGDYMEQKEDVGSDDPLPPYHDVPVEDIVSHVESLPNVNEAAYTSVRLLIL
jgi:hypothetical protein